MYFERNSRRAFTIVELLVAAAITILIVVLLGTMFGSLTKTTSRASRRIDSFREARAALQMMERDLSSLVRTQWEPDPFATPSPTVTPLPITRPAAYLTLKNVYSDPAPGNQQLYALISLKNTGPSDVCSVGYYCSWDGNAYSLRRYFRSSDKTFATLSSPSPTPPPNPSATPDVYISEDDLYKPNPSPSPSPTDDVLAQYVWNLKVTAYDAAGNVIRENPADSNSPPKYPFVCDAKDSSDEIIPISPIGTARPAAIEISFKAMSSEAARTVMSVSNDPMDWMDSTRSRYKLLIAPNAYQFRTRIKL